MEHVFPQSCMRYFSAMCASDRLVQAMNGVDFCHSCGGAQAGAGGGYNPMECIKTNIHGAENVIHAALANNVEKVIALSTDKAAIRSICTEHEARLRQTVRCRQQHSRRAPDQILRRALWKRGRIARLRRAFLQEADRQRQRSPTDYGRGNDSILDHPAAGRGFRPQGFCTHARRGNLCSKDSVRPCGRPRARHGA